LNAEPKEPRKRPRLIWLILVDLLAAYVPWVLFAGLVVAPSYPELPSSRQELDTLLDVLPTLLIVVLKGPIFSSAMVIGINSTAGAGATVLWSATFVCHLGLLVFLQRRYYRWFKYLVPAHLFIVSGIAIAKYIWWQ